jgi:arylsulfatase A-like enzyme
MIVFSFLAGASLGALLDAIFALPITGLEGMHREYFLLVMGSALACAVLAGLAFLLTARTPGFGWLRRCLDDGRAFWPGCVFGAVPLLASLAGDGILYFRGSQHWMNLAIWIALVGVGVLLAPALSMLFRPSEKQARLLTACAALAFVVVWLLPTKLRPAEQIGPKIPAVAVDFTPAQVGPDRPDLVLVSIDTLRADLGHRSQFLLPVLEQWREQGTWADYALSPANQTVPGHVAMLTGLEHGQHGIARNIDRKELKTIEFFSNQLHAAGYRTAAVVSNAMMLGKYGWARGYEVYDDSDAEPGGAYFFVQVTGRLGWTGVGLGAGPSKRLVSRLFGVNPLDIQPPAQSLYATGQAESYIAEFSKSDAPYHLMVHYMDPHAPYAPPEETAGVFTAESLAKPFRRFSNDHRALLPRVEKALEEGETRAGGEAAAAHLRALYDEEILFMDSQLRRLAAAIEASGRATVLVVTSDHGEFFGEHHKMEHGKFLFGPVVRVPFLAIGLNGGKVPARKLDKPVDLIDIAPSLLDAAGLPIPEKLRGRSFLREDFPELDHIARWGSMVSIRRGDYKILVKLDIAGRAIGSYLGVYNLRTDPNEEGGQIDYSDVPGYQELQQRLEQLAGEVAELAVLFPQELAPVAEQVMAEALGYLDAVGEPIKFEQKEERE